MSMYSRGSLPDGEDERLHALTLKILELLRFGPVTNKYLAAVVCLDYRRRINELRRHHGYHIKATRWPGRVGGKGVFEYRLLDEPEPEWEVEIKLIAPDGQFLVYKIVVNALTATEARNNGPRKYVRSEIISVHKKDSDEPATPPRRPVMQVRAIEIMNLRRENEELRELIKKLYARWKLDRAGKNG